MAKFNIKKFLGSLATGLVIIGALNWGLIGLFNTDLVNLLFGNGMITKVIYSAVGISGVYKLLEEFKFVKR